MPDALLPSLPLRTKPENVAFATPADEADLYGFLVSLWSHNDNGWGIFFDPQIVARQIEVGTRSDPTTRTDPTDQRRGTIGIIRDAEGGIVASVGLFIMPPVWYTNLPSLTELWLYVRPEARDASRLECDLFDFSLWAHDHMKRDLAGNWSAPFPMSTGFMHRGERFAGLERLWRMRSGGKKVGVLFMRD